MKGLSPNNFSTSIFVIEIKYSDGWRPAPVGINGQVSPSDADQAYRAARRRWRGLKIRITQNGIPLKRKNLW